MMKVGLGTSGLLGQTLIKEIRSHTKKVKPDKSHKKFQHMSGGGDLLPKFMPISFFRRVSRF